MAAGAPADAAMAASADLTERLQKCTAEKMLKFEGLRSRKVACAFWDIVVLTATDKAQADAYTLILNDKVDKKEIPPAKYHVFHDPPGPKIGNGGATMHALTELEKVHPGVLDDAKVLLIHAGGFSKRLPNVSVVGKIFAVLPFGDPVFTMLEMKLASYIDFPAKMAPGVFVTCADDIELMDCEGDLEFTGAGFTALGHPSSLEIGTTHGVFILDAASKAAAAEPSVLPACTRAVCTRFTHKPTIERMKALGAEIPGTELVYTDSAYYFDRPTSLKLQAFFAAQAPLSCEIDAYGDFLQALGPEATDEYTRDDKNVIVADGGLAEMRLKLYHHLKGTPLHVILCNVSKFYHIGTLPEFLFHYCSDSYFRGETSALHNAFVGGAGKEELGEEVTVIHSLVAEGVKVAKQSVIEYSVIGAGAQIGTQCLISSTEVPPGAVVPDGIFLHTTKTKLGFVTIVFGTGEDMKTGAKPADASAMLTYCNVPLGEVLDRLGCTVADLWADETQKCTLWNASVFPVFDTVGKSVSYALEVAAVATGGARPAVPPMAGVRRLRMEEILVEKDLEGVLIGREELRKKIAAK